MTGRKMNRRDFLAVTAAGTGGLLTHWAIPTSAIAAPAGQKPAEDMYFRLVTHGGDDPFWAVVHQGMRDAAEVYGCKVEIDLAGGDLANQQKKFQERSADVTLRSYREIQAEIRAYATRYGIGMVQRFSADPATSSQPQSVAKLIYSQVVWHNTHLDITDVVIDWLNNRRNGGPRPPETEARRPHGAPLGRTR